MVARARSVQVSGWRRTVAAVLTSSVLVLAPLVVGTVPLPEAAAVGVVAVTEVPAVAASAPVLVGSC